MDIEHHTIKKYLLIASITIVSIFSISYWIYSQFNVNTDDAYINANTVKIAPRVTGKVKTLYVENNQYVTNGQLLFEIDPETFEASLAESKAGLDIAEAKLKIAKITADRILSLVNNRAASHQEGDIAQGNLEAAAAQRDLNKALFMAAELNLNFTKIYAVTSGWITNMSLRVGDSVIANQPVFALVSDQKFWVDANFKENRLEDLEINQHATIKIDMYPKHKFLGVIESFSSGTGNAFSLFPPENATGNWVKVTQRVPVKIRIINYDPKYPLVVGTSATVNININPFNSDHKNKIFKNN